MLAAALLPYGKGMRWYRDITYWENSSRIEALRQFRSDVVSYFARSRANWQPSDLIEEPDAEQYRRSINLALTRIHEILRTAGIPMMVQHHASPVQAGWVQNLNVIVNINTAQSHLGCYRSRYRDL
jgi:hypothetical protein